MTESKPNIFGKIVGFFKDCKSEIKKTIWPKPKAVFKNTGIVLVMILVVGVFVASLDAGSINLLSLVMSVSKQ